MSNYSVKMSNEENDQLVQALKNEMAQGKDDSDSIEKKHQNIAKKEVDQLVQALKDEMAQNKEDSDSINEKLQYIAQIEKELRDEIKQSKKHCDYFVFERNPEQDLEIAEIRNQWKRFTRQQEKLLDILTMHRVKVKIGEKEYKLSEMKDGTEIYFVYLHGKCTNLIPRATESLLKTQKKINRVYKDIREIIKTGQL